MGSHQFVEEFALFRAKLYMKSDYSTIILVVSGYRRKKCSKSEIHGDKGVVGGVWMVSNKGNNSL